jgi:hypothetical protein
MPRHVRPWGRRHLDTRLMSPSTTPATPQGAANGTRRQAEGRPHAASDWDGARLVLLVAMLLALRPLAAATAFAYGDLPVADDGYLTWPLSADARLVHVSNAGNDANDGATPETAVATLTRANSLLRPGFPDRMLLRSGDTWTGTKLDLGIGGRSLAEPMIVGRYGIGARPLIRLGLEASFISSVTGTLKNLVLDGLELTCPAKDPADPAYAGSGTSKVGAFYAGNGCANIVIHDCRFRFQQVTAGNQYAAGEVRKLILWRTVIGEAWSTSSQSTHCQGLLAESVVGLLVHECVFFRNGWHPVARPDGTVFDHNLYIQGNCQQVTVRGTISADAASHGCQLRPGGVLANNAFIRNPLATFAGWNPAGAVPNHVWVHHNSVLEGRNITKDLVRGWAYQMMANPSATWEYNLALDQTEGIMNQGGFMPPKDAEWDGVPMLHPLRCRFNLVRDWSREAPSVLGIYTSEVNPARVSVEGNRLLTGDETDVPDARADLLGYMRSLGHAVADRDAAYDLFMAKAQEQRRGSHDPRYTAPALNAWLREQLGGAGWGGNPDAPVASSKGASTSASGAGSGCGNGLIGLLMLGLVWAWGGRLRCVQPLRRH